MIKISGLNTNDVRALQNGGLDINGQPPERTISDGTGNPCRHCLENIAKGEEMLILAYRPFKTIQPYAEQGPIFLHANLCPTHEDRREGEAPSVLKTSSHYLLRGYGRDERIVYGTGCVTPKGELVNKARKILKNSTVKFIHVRSASNNCYQARIDRA